MAKPLGGSCSGVESCLGSSDNDPYPGTCDVSNEDPSGVSCVPEDEDTTNKCTSNESPCVTSTCDPYSGNCIVEPSWSTEDPAPACNVEKNASSGQGAPYQNGCGAGHCVACQDGEPGCNAAKCEGIQAAGVQNCDFFEVKGDQQCIDAAAQGEQLYCAATGSCEQPCRSWSVPCRKCLRVENGNNGLNGELIGLINSTMKQYVMMAPETQFYEEFLAEPTVWGDFVNTCVPVVFPAYLPQQEISPESNAQRQAMSICAMDYLKSVPPETPIMVNYGGAIEELSNGLAEALLVIMGAEGLCLTCSKDQGYEYTCDSLADTGIPATFPSCSKDLGMSNIGFGFGEWVYEAEYCVRQCESEVGAPESICDGFSCVLP